MVSLLGRGLDVSQALFPSGGGLSGPPPNGLFLSLDGDVSSIPPLRARGPLFYFGGYPLHPEIHFPSPSSANVGPGKVSIEGLSIFNPSSQIAVNTLPVPFPQDEPVFFWVDHTSHFPSNTGVQRVTRSLARALQELNQQIYFVSWDPKTKSLRALTENERLALTLFNGPVSDGLSWAGELGGLSGKWLIMPEVPHVTFHPVSPMTDLLSFTASHGMRTAWIFYDAIPYTTPGYETMKPAHEAYMKGLAGADRIFPISKSAGEDLEGYWKKGAIHGKARVVPVLLPGEFPGAQRPSVQELSTPPFRFLCIGSVERRKNHERLLTAFNRFSREFPHVDVRLTIAGNVGGDLFPMLHEAIVENPSIEFLGFVPDEKLQDLYAKSHATIFPSIAEGYGLPIIESLWHGRPCLCANFGAMGEVAAGGGCLGVNTYLSAEIFEGIRTLVFDPETCRQLVREATGRSFRTWKDYAATILDGLEMSREPLSVG